MMELAPGQRLGRFELLAPLGEGGMGTVWRARDTQLGRLVALKLIHPDRSADPDRRARFAKEASAVATLTHPHIGTLYDHVVHDGRDILALEYLEGPTLQTRLLAHPAGLPVADALAAAVPIGEALAFAHAHQLVHRDVKPANVILAGVGVKLVDFGLAVLSREPTGVTSATMTTERDVAGTLPYMAPEQFDGRADARTDVFAFGAMLFEMLTGTRAFPGHSATEVMGAILRPDRPRLPDRLRHEYPALVRAIEKCLSLDPARRWQSMADLTDELRWLRDSPPRSAIGDPAKDVRSRVPTWLAAVAALAAAALGTLGGARVPAVTRSSPPPASHLFFSLGPGQSLGSEGLGPELAVSRDGSRIAYVAGGATSQLYLRTLDSGVSQPIPGTDEARAPFFSPDGRSLGYFAHGQIWRMLLPDGPPQAVCATVSGEADWGADDVIRFSTYGPSEPIWSVPASGGTRTPVTAVLPGVGHFAPQFLPDTGALLFSERRLDASGVTFTVMLQPAGSHESTRVVEGAQRGRLLDAGRLLYQVDSQILLSAVDGRRMVLQGTPSVVLGDVPSGDFNIAAWSATSDVLAYRAGSARQRRLVWTSRDGISTPLTAPLRGYSTPRLSPDERRVAVEVSSGANFDVWLYDLEREALTPLTVDHLSRYPQWTPDGRFVTVSRRKVDGHDIYWREADGSGDLRELWPGGSGGTYAESWTPDGGWFVFWEGGARNQGDVFAVDMKHGRQRRAVVQTADTEVGGRLSPDGRWLAYMSMRSGRPEVFVKAFADSGQGQQVSSDGGSEAVWARNGRELYFRNNTQLLAVSVEARDGLRIQKPRVLFDKPFYRYGGPALVHYDVAADGRFLMIEEFDVSRPEIGVIQGLAMRSATVASPAR